MYRIDAVDQDNEFTRLELLRSASQVAAFPTSDSNYRFAFTPTLGGDVQVKLWVTCLGRQSEPAQSHQHTWALTSARVDLPLLALAPGVQQFNHSLTCAAGEIAVQPGWQLTAPAGGTITPFRSYPTANFQGWSFSFIVDQTSDLHLYLSCLKLKSSTVNTHAHRIVVSWKPGFAGSQRFLPISDNRRDQDLACGEHYKAMLGGWRIPDPTHVWYFGMEPRIKARTYWFAWDGVGVNNDVFLVNGCFKDRTT